MREILNIRMLNVRAAPPAVLAGSDGAGRAGAECEPNRNRTDRRSDRPVRKLRGQVTRQPKRSERRRTKSPAGGPHEGIKIHGHWVIDLRSPKGELVEHREFESSYAGHLPTSLAGQVSVGGMGNGPDGRNIHLLHTRSGNRKRRSPPALDRRLLDCYQHRHCLSSTKSN
jgi:hypothetical protein